MERNTWNDGFVRTKMDRETHGDSGDDIMVAMGIMGNIFGV